MSLKIWKIWKYALGSFSDDKTEPYDNHIVIIRSLIFVSILSTNLFIVVGVVRHWNDGQQLPRYENTLYIKLGSSKVFQ